MKKSLLILLALVVALLSWFYLTKQAPQNSPNHEPTNTIVELPSQQPETNLTAVATNTYLPEPVSLKTNAIEPVILLTNALTATNLEQWKTAISGLKKLAGFTVDQHWLVEQPGAKQACLLI